MKHAQDQSLSSTLDDHLTAEIVNKMLVEILKMDPITKSKLEFQKWYDEHIAKDGVDTNVEAEMINAHCDKEAKRIAERISMAARKGMYAEWYRLVKGGISSDKVAVKTIDDCAGWIHGLLIELDVKGASFPLGGLYAVSEYMKNKNRKAKK